MPILIRDKIYQFYIIKWKYEKRLLIKEELNIFLNSNTIQLNFALYKMIRNCTFEFRNLKLDLIFFHTCGTNVKEAFIYYNMMKLLFGNLFPVSTKTAPSLCFGFNDFLKL